MASPSRNSHTLIGTPRLLDSEALNLRHKDAKKKKPTARAEDAGPTRPTVKKDLDSDFRLQPSASESDSERMLVASGGL